jgi:Mrp family chromosome partitioning ATPase
MNAIEVVTVGANFAELVPMPVAQAPDSAMAASFRALHRRLERLGDPRVVAITSPGRRDGKTTCAIGLAMAIAENQAEPVLLVEGALARPSLAAAFGFTPPVPFGEQLVGAAEDCWLAADVGFHGLHVLAANPAGERRRLTGATLRALFAASAVAGYRHVVVDAPAVADGADAQILADACDGVLLAARALHTKASALKHAAEELAPAELLGAVMVG